MALKYEIWIFLEKLKTCLRIEFRHQEGFKILSYTYKHSHINKLINECINRKLIKIRQIKNVINGLCNNVPWFFLLVNGCPAMHLNQYVHVFWAAFDNNWWTRILHKLCMHFVISDGYHGMHSKHFDQSSIVILWGLTTEQSGCRHVWQHDWHTKSSL